MSAAAEHERDPGGPSRASSRAGRDSPGPAAAQRKWSSTVGVILVSTLLFFVLWQAVAWIVGSPYLPGPVETGRALIDALSRPDFLGFTMWEHVRSSLGRIIIGFAAAAVVAIPLGLVAGWFRFVETFASPWVEMTRPIPPLAWIPFAIVFFGTPLDAVFIVFLASFFPIYLNTVAGVKSVEPLLIDAARTLGARKAFLFTRVIVPGSLAHISIGLRLGLGYAWMSIVAAEILGVKGGGLGIFLWTMHEVGRFDAVFAGMVIIGVLGMLLTRGISFWRAAESV
ncbi:MAG TPA: ABC transporter permease [Anaerolineales bacterium]|nr:ABC transporter permease [Anaerolineales bacterium]